jgi:AraC family transcriptional regulator
MHGYGILASILAQRGLLHSTAMSTLRATDPPLGIEPPTPFEQPTSRAALPENVVDIAKAERTWGSVHLAVTEFQCQGRVVHRLGSETDPRLTTLLDEVGGRCEPRLREGQPCSVAYIPRHMTFMPAGMEVWGYADGLRFARDATLQFDSAGLEARLGTRIDAQGLHDPRLRFADDGVWTLIRLLSDVVNDSDPSTQLYGDGLATAISARLFSRRTDEGASGQSGLARWQLRRVIEFLTDALPDRVELSELAALTGLSESHFSKAFKASTGLAPYRWQLDARIRRAQELLCDTDASLEHVAQATGFADAVHFGRTFRKFVGTSPAAWRLDRKR